jgi:hypothetical protein
MITANRPLLQKAAATTVVLALVLVSVGTASAGSVPVDAGLAHAGVESPIVQVRNGSKAAAIAIIGGIAALGVGAAIASQGRRSDPGYGYNGGYAPAYAPPPQPYDEPQPGYAPSADYYPSGGYEEEEPYYVPAPPPVYYPGRRARYGYGAPAETIYHDPYGNSSRLLPEGR